MKLPSDTSATRRCSATLLIECLVYCAVFVILLGIGTAAFCFCWDHTRAVILTANDIESALRAGESWRADVRAATGTISVKSLPSGQVVAIPEGKKVVRYRLADGELSREVSPPDGSRVLLEKVKASEMKTEPNSAVTAWHWELEVTPPRADARFPLLFTFAAVQPRR